MENNKKKRTHRIGTITCGTALIIFGILFLLHLFMPILSYQFIFRLWPCILIMLGIEILIGNFISGRKDDASEDIPVSFVYDKGAVILLLLLLIFAMAMAVADEWTRYFILWENEYYSTSLFPTYFFRNYLI